MTKDTLGGFSDIDKFVDHKLSELEKSDKTLRALYGLMFSEGENIICESTDGYRITRTTYAQCHEGAEDKAARLAVLFEDIPRGSMIGMCFDNSREWIELFWGILRAGYRPLLFNTRLADETLSEVVREYGLKAVVTEKREFPTRNVTSEEISRTTPRGAPDEGVFANEVLLMSSNTSGNLKICGYTGEQFSYQIKDSGRIIKESRSIKKHYNGSLKLLTFLPFNHIFGLVAVYIWFCFFSRTLVFLKDFAPKTIIHTIQKHEVTHIFAVPLFWDKVYKSAVTAIEERGESTVKRFEKGMRISGALSCVPFLGKAFAKKAFKEIRDNMFGNSAMFLINGGGYISEEVMRFMNGIGYHLVNGYGMTELGITSVELSEKAKVRNLRSVGRPFSSLEYRISESGELLVRGKSIAAAVYSHGEKLPSEEWFNTHDMFSEKDGRYYISGRQDDLIICADGENVNPNLYEPMLTAAGVERVCIAPSPDNTGRLTVIAEVNRFSDKTDFRNIYAQLAAKLKELKLDGVTDKLLLTGTSLLEADDFKLNRKRIARRLANGELGVIDPERPEAEIDEADKELTEKVTRIVAETLHKRSEEIKPDAHFFLDLGGSSLDYYTAIMDIQTEFGVSFPATSDSNASTVREMVICIKRKLGTQ